MREKTTLLEFKVLRRRLGDLTLEEIWDPNREGLFSFHAWEPLKLPE